MSEEILAFDPGGTTGVARCVLPDENAPPTSMDEWALDSWQIGTPSDSHLMELEDLLYARRPALLVYEDFLYRAYTGRDDKDESEAKSARRTHLNLVSKEYIGVIKLYGFRNSIPVVRQTPGTGLQFVKDKRLKSLDLYVPGRTHGNDAMRHLLYYLVFTLKLKEPFVSLWKSWANSPDMV